MISFVGKRRYFLYGAPTDMRKGFAGLSGIVRQHMQQDLLSGDVFIFINRRRDRIKLLMWDEMGFVLYYKQLERGTFERLNSGESGHIELSISELLMLLEGIEIKSIKRRKRYKKTG